MHFLITGHTGFKGTWLTHMLVHKGHLVSGIALDPGKDSLFNESRAQEKILKDFRIDINDRHLLVDAIDEIKPDFTIHLAAQPLVLDSYVDPAKTFNTNVIGTMNLLDALSQTKSNLGTLVATTDKVYRNNDSGKIFKEKDPLGGDDPYSASKAMVEILCNSWRKSFSQNIATARAGNVIGGGDYSQNRLIPDIFRSLSGGDELQIRNLQATRPWQHVLDCLNGYIAQTEFMLSNKDIWEFNFGPEESEIRNVDEVLIEMKKHFRNLTFQTQENSQTLKEKHDLRLDSKLANEILGWKPKLSFEQSIYWTADFYKRTNAGEDAREVCERQIAEFFSNEITLGTQH